MYKYIEILKKILVLFPEDLFEKYKQCDYDSYEREDYEEIIYLKREILETAAYDLESYNGETNPEEVEKYYKEIVKARDDFIREIDEFR